MSKIISSNSAWSASTKAPQVKKDQGRSMSEQFHDLLLYYCHAMDAGNIDKVIVMYELARTIPGFQAALSSIHLRFNCDESWTQQLLSYRKQFQECGER